MGKESATRYIAVVEQCVMTEVALRYLLNAEVGASYRIQFFKDAQSLKQVFNVKNISAVIFSLSGHRQPRLESLLFLHEIACSHPDVRRIILANDRGEVRLIHQLTPSCLHGVLNKSVRRELLQEQLLSLLAPPPDEPYICQHPQPCGYILSPTEHSILRYMTYGYSLSEIAIQLDRNIKTIRAHKCNAMIKLGVRSDIGLLSAADLLMHLSLNGEKTAEVDFA
ncbi:DNA-binding transcriptional activator BglJ [Klebsiella sp. NPDC088457]